MYDNITNMLENSPNFPTQSSVRSRIEVLEGLIPMRRIELIKTIRSWYGVTLKDAKFCCDSLCELRDKDTALLIEALRMLASGSINTPEKDEKAMIHGINIAINTWKDLGYPNVRSAIIDFLHRTS